MLRITKPDVRVRGDAKLTAALSKTKCTLRLNIAPRSVLRDAGERCGVQPRVHRLGGQPQPYGYDNNVSRITGNVLRRFLESIPF
jgi:hypothetical protein